jgi:Protein of unknown function (DUF2917)
MRIPSQFAMQSVQISLTDGQLVQIAGPITLKVAGGVFWVTQPGHGQDLFLQAGQALTLRQGETALVEAQAGGSFTAQQPCHEALLIGGAMARWTLAALARALRGLSTGARAAVPQV